ncbi:hypothetical protein NL676_001710 [Syzygium grande]|nr:hypothetical protein NL676_001710 [Syzygium grande]
MPSPFPPPRHRHANHHANRPRLATSRQTPFPPIPTAPFPPRFFSSFLPSCRHAVFSSSCHRPSAPHANTTILTPCCHSPPFTMTLPPATSSSPPHLAIPMHEATTILPNCHAPATPSLPPPCHRPKAVARSATVCTARTRVTPPARTPVDR